MPIVFKKIVLRNAHCTQIPALRKHNREDVGLKSAWMTQPDPAWMQANNQTEVHNADLRGKKFYTVIQATENVIFITFLLCY